MEGLSAEEAKARKECVGPNRLPSAAKQSEVLRFLRQFHNLLIYVLLGAALLAASIGHYTDAAVILAVIVVNAIIGYLQEGRAERALDAIRTMIDPRSTVVRDGRRLVIPAEDIVPGDLVLLEPGDRVPADLRLARARNLRIDEAALTGESVPVDKGIEPVVADIPLGDRSSVAFSGTFVAAGTGVGIAVATGTETELGRISELVGSVKSLTTPLLRQIAKLAEILTIVILGVCAGVFAFAVLVRGYQWPEAFMVIIGIAVAAIPEGLPAVMTITLAIGVQRMAARNAIVRRLPAVETLGSVSVICSDKTGTLTRNEMTVRTVITTDKVIEVSGVGYRPEGGFEIEGGRLVDPADDPTLLEAVRAAILCNDAELGEAGGAWITQGDPMEGALLSLGIKAGHDAGALRKQFPRTDEIPFDTQHQFMATLHHSHDDRAFAYVKGAPERILAMCTSQLGPSVEEPLDEAFWRSSTETVATRGQRVLALAVKAMPQGKRDLAFVDAAGGFTMLALLGLIDPPREEARKAVEDCRSAGIEVKMITGDHAATAAAIARLLKLDDEPKVITGQALDRLDDAELEKVAREVTVFARTSPVHKLRLVTALQASGAVTAMTGDGVNDAPALKRADIGVAMGSRGTEAAKEAAELVLADDNFASIVAAVREGRTVYDNLRKVIEWTLPTNGGEVAGIIVAIAFGLTLPMTAIQLLWINLATAVTLGLTLAFEPTEPGAMQRPPRDVNEPLLSGFLLWRVGLVSLLFMAGVFGIFFYALGQGLSLEVARTMVVNTIVVMEIFYLFSIRYVHGPSITWTGVLGTPAVLIGVALVVAMQFAFTYVPAMQRIFGTAPIGLLDGLLIVGVGVALLLLVELEKRIVDRVPTARAMAKDEPEPASIPRW